MTTPSPQSGSVVATLSWMIPIAGIVLWVVILPSTRALMRRRMERFTRSEPLPTPEVSGTEKSTSPRKREEDPEILGFDREVVRAKFAKARPERSG